MQNFSERLSMKNVIFVIGLFLLLFIIILSIYNNEPSGRYYNCRDIDFLPDVPPKVRQECRRIIRERIEEQKKLQEEKLIST